MAFYFVQSVKAGQDGLIAGLNVRAPHGESRFLSRDEAISVLVDGGTLRGDHNLIFASSVEGRYYLKTVPVQTTGDNLDGFRVEAAS